MCLRASLREMRVTTMRRERSVSGEQWKEWYEIFPVSLAFSRYFFQYTNLHLRVNVTKDQSRCFQGFVDLADFHIYSTVFHADSYGVVCFS